MKYGQLTQLTVALLITFLGLSANAQTANCNKTTYLTFDTGNMAVAEKVAEILKRQEVKATFFLSLFLVSIKGESHYSLIKTLLLF